MKGGEGADGAVHCRRPEPGFARGRQWSRARDEACLLRKSELRADLLAPVVVSP